MKVDISTILEQWPYESGQITVRKIIGADGREKVQLRLDLGLLQMELQGRPDGRRPHGFDCVRDYAESLLEGYTERHGNSEGFKLNSQLVRELQDEALMNYHRYLSLFVLEDFEGVARDTNSNLRIFDLLARFAQDPDDRRSMEQYRPYVTMMNTRARAQQAMAREEYPRAVAIINSGLAAIKDFFHVHGRPRLFRRSTEAAVLRELRREVSAHLPRDPLRSMERRLARAVGAERYEEAAALRDQIEQIKTERKSQVNGG